MLAVQNSVGVGGGGEAHGCSPLLRIEIEVADFAEYTEISLQEGGGCTGRKLREGEA